MRDVAEEQRTDELVLEYEFDEPPEKVWRAVSTPELREKWLPEELLADGEPVSSIPGREVRYRMEDDEAPFLASVVTFEVRPRADGGTQLRIVHCLVDTCLDSLPQAANSNWPTVMRAA